MIRASNWSISSVWLTASAVRYMICKLLRARANQGDDVSLSGRRENLAAFGLVHRVDDPRAVLSSCRETMLILSARSSTAAFGHAGVKQQRAAKLQLVAAGQLVLFDLPAVDERAVRAAQIANEERVAAAGELGMFARNFRIVQLHGIRWCRGQALPFARPAGSECPDRDLGSQTAMAR